MELWKSTAIAVEKTDLDYKYLFECPEVKSQSFILNTFTAVAKQGFNLITMCIVCTAL